MNMVADKCDECGKVVVKTHDSASSDMIVTRGSILYLCDTVKGESSRPSFLLQRLFGSDTPKVWCPDCLVKALSRWVNDLEQRGSSAIPPEHIIPGRQEEPPVCRFCGK